MKPTFGQRDVGLRFSGDPQHDLVRPASRKGSLATILVIHRDTGNHALAHRHAGDRCSGYVRALPAGRLASAAWGRTAAANRGTPNPFPSWRRDTSTRPDRSGRVHESVPRSSHRHRSPIAFTSPMLCDTNRIVTPETAVHAPYACTAGGNRCRLLRAPRRPVGSPDPRGLRPRMPAAPSCRSSTSLPAGR